LGLGLKNFGPWPEEFLGLGLKKFWPFLALKAVKRFLNFRFFFSGEILALADLLIFLLFKIFVLQNCGKFNKNFGIGLILEKIL